MSRADFITRFGGVYENSPWVAEGAWPLPEDSTITDALRAVVDGAGHDRQLALLRAHPDLAGRLAIGGHLTAESTAEQAGAGLDQCSAGEFAEFQDLNARYTARFGFPFILAVRGHDRGSILDAFRHRVANAPEDEFREALTQVHRIAALRIADLTKEPT